jgi:hypothetical protein
MPELNEYQPACIVNGIGNAPPPCSLFRVKDTWGSIPSLSLFAYEGALRKEKRIALHRTGDQIVFSDVA